MLFLSASGEQHHAVLCCVSRATTVLCCGVLCSGQLYLLHVETINLLLVLASTQLYSTSASAPVGTHPFIDALMQQQPLAAPVAQRALEHYSSRPPLPPKLQLWSPSPDAQEKGVLKLVRSAAGQLITHAHVTRLAPCAVTDAWVSHRHSLNAIYTLASVQPLITDYKLFRIDVQLVPGSQKSCMHFKPLLDVTWVTDIWDC